MLFLESKIEQKLSVINKQHIYEVWHYRFSNYYKFVMPLIWSINYQHVTEEVKQWMRDKLLHIYLLSCTYI